MAIASNGDAGQTVHNSVHNFRSVVYSMRQQKSKPSKCIYRPCPSPADGSHGLCKRHERQARLMVKKGVTTWEKLTEAKLAVFRKRTDEGFRKAILQRAKVEA